MGGARATECAVPTGGFVVLCSASFFMHSIVWRWRNLATCDLGRQSNLKNNHNCTFRFGMRRATLIACSTDFCSGPSTSAGLA